LSQEFEDKNGNILYVGPKCMDDGTKIGVGVFSDQYCSKDTGKSYYHATGITVNKEYLTTWYSDDVCLSCKESSMYVGERTNETRGANDGSDECHAAPRRFAPRVLLAFWLRVHSACC